MSFWDRIKPSTPPPAVVSTQLSEDGTRLRLAWDDGQGSEASAQALRQACPCAGCVDEWTKQRTVDPASIPASLRISELHAVGNYALGITFSDGHATGLFSWPVLRSLTRPATT